MAADRRELLALSGAILAGLAGCTAELGPRTDERDGEPTVRPAADDERRVDPDAPAADVDELVANNTAFALSLYDRLVDEEPGADHFVSPFGISMALAMTWAGARGQTEDAMADALAFTLDQDALHPAFNALSRRLDERSERDGGSDDGSGNDGGDARGGDGGDPLELNVANALWPREGVDLREEFLDTVAAHYGARPVALDYGDPEAASETINDWVADETEDRIDDLVSPESLSDDPPLVLTNAIYFLAGWLEEFDESDTRDHEFTALDGSTGEVSMMSQAETFPYAAVDGHRLIELPYVGAETSMVVVLPAEGEFEAFEADLDADRLAELLGELERERGRIELPRFELETSYSLPDHLAALGMEVAFGAGADFGGMAESGEGWFIDDVIHDAFVAVDEEGTEAAAATAVIMGDSAPPPESFEMTVDRPFLFLVRDRPTGAVLFLGRVVDVPSDPG